MAASASIIFYCLPLLQDYGSYQTWIYEPDKSSYKPPSVRSGNDDDDFFATMSAKYSETITHDDTDACGSYEYFVQEDWGRYFVQPDASQSEINRAKEVLFNAKVEEYLSYLNESEAKKMAKHPVETCFTPAILSMHKKVLECNSVYVSFTKRFYGKEDLLEYLEIEKKTFWEELCEGVGLSSKDCDGCMEYKKTLDTCQFTRWRNQYFNLSLYPGEARIFLKNEPNELETTEAKKAIAKQIILNSDGEISILQIEKCWYNIVDFNVSSTCKIRCNFS